MNWGLLILYILTGIGVLFAANKHGQPKTDKNNFWFSLIASVIYLVLIWWACGWRFI